MSGDISFKTIEECEEVATSMAELQKSKGWLYFDAAMTRALAHIVDKLPNLNDEFERTKAIGEMVQIRKARAFPATMSNAALSSRERLKAKEEKKHGR